MLAIISPVFWALTLQVNFLQRTALPMWLGMLAGLILAIVAARRDRRTRTRVVAGLNLLWVAFSVVGYAVFTRLPETPEFAALGRVNMTALPDHTGRLRELGWTRDGIGPGGGDTAAASSGLSGERGLLLVFYRGHW